MKLANGLYRVEYVDSSGVEHAFHGYLEDYCLHGKVVLNGIEGLTVVQSKNVTLLRPLKRGEVKRYMEFQSAFERGVKNV